ncbi:major facilitator transporter [Afipia sp. P52-10]|uniref:multidrug effflux MFS transporter n=1 Tax=Afipia sp. P52-10 TaxID=1429916 RepID=UPI0003DF347E|nr:multidrug effflux MFS transporter [Afipia sp. P52-10]ETR79187.1 major facilitator transporter [Afipia sp. P52-10]
MSAVAQEASSRHQPMGLTEFVVFSSAAMAINSLAISIMLAALPQIAQVFAMSDPNRQQMVLTIFMVGFSAGQLLIGPLADRYGRRAMLSIGLAGYAVATLACIVAPSFELLLVARLAQGLCSATPRIISVSTVRDCYIGPQMARIMSLVMMVLFIAPVVAPTIGQIILSASNWQVLFAVLFVHGLVVLIWGWARLPETQPAEQRRPLSANQLVDSCRTFFTNPQSAITTLAAGICQGCLLAFLVSSPQVIGEHYGLGHHFTYAFSAIAVTMGLAAFYNSRIVARFGLMMIARASLAACAVAVLLAGGLVLWGTLSFAAFMATFFVLNSLLLMNSANFTAIAMAPHGAIAGTASSLYGASTTFISAVIAGSIGHAYDGGPAPLVLGSLACCVAALLLLELGARAAKAHAQTGA